MSKELIEKFKKPDSEYYTLTNEEAEQCAVIALEHTIEALEELHSMYGIGDREMTNIPKYQKQLEQLKTK